MQEMKQKLEIEKEIIKFVQSRKGKETMEEIFSCFANETAKIFTCLPEGGDLLFFLDMMKQYYLFWKIKGDLICQEKE